MTTIIVSLGSIVKTDASKAIMAFQNLANSLDLGIQVPLLMKQLHPLFIDFNVGKLSTEDFKTAISSIFFEQAQKQDNDSKKVFSEQFEACWNAMCEIDQQARDVVQYIAKQSLLKTQNKIRIYSDTNDIHFNHFNLEINKDEDSSDALEMSVDTTCASHCSKEELLLRMVEELREKNPQEEITLVLGKNDQIKDPTLLAMTEQRDAKVVSAACSSELRIHPLEGPRLSISDLKSLMMPIEESKPPVTHAFNAGIAARRQDSPRLGLSDVTIELEVLDIATDETRNRSHSFS